MFASAAGLTLPLTVAAPPMMTTSATWLMMRGSNKSARAILVSGPTGTSVTSPGCAMIVSTINCAAVRGWGCKVGAGWLVLPSPSSPCTKAAAPWYITCNGLAAPCTTGTDERPANSTRCSAFCVAVAVSTLPKMVVRPSTSSSGAAKAKRIAIASSIPGSVSIIIFLVMGELLFVVGWEVTNCSEGIAKSPTWVGGLAIPSKQYIVSKRKTADGIDLDTLFMVVY